VARAVATAKERVFVMGAQVARTLPVMR